MRKVFLVLLLSTISVALWAQVGYVQEGKASFYADKFEGRTTASGERYSHSRSTCAHLTLPFGTLVRVTNTANNQSVIVRVNDRGPFVPNRIIDLSRSAADKLGFISTGITDVKIEVIDSEGNVATPSAPSTKPVVITESKQPAPTINAKPAIDGAKEPQRERPAIQAPKITGGVAENTNQGDMELYDINVTRQKPTGFTVQIGSYKELANLLRIANDLRESLKKEVRVQVATINSDKVYRLMVGDFKSRRDAESFRDKAAQIYPDCFIVELR